MLSPERVVPTAQTLPSSCSMTTTLGRPRGGGPAVTSPDRASKTPSWHGQYSSPSVPRSLRQSTAQARWVQTAE